MQRITISIDDDLAEDFDRLIAERGYRNRSEAFRDLIRGAKADAAVASPDPDAICVASASYVYDHHERQLSTRLTEIQHAHGGLVISLMHAHVSGDDCLETVFLRGRIAEVRAFADALVAEPGVRHGAVSIVPVDDMSHGHAHPHDHDHDHSHGHDHDHVHTHPHSRG
ncbi:nickel-responsive transcriptional regulator NikR [Sutterella sp.]|uniref:nickel-responsive transcriptional regulator NikR n=1 Tax=Sutterella sp. TaxID=1981025 RepID=UPI0026E0ED7C|nr:nickel-responsive transcriptional regulator NikR [Sutterella sp.]MDO5531796.1 nickel-responsive transcriptional regulator NikR [Sutterella sp.]